MEDLDDFDTALLRELQKDARRTAEQFSAVIGLSPAAIQRRLKRLRESGVIAREVAILDPATLGACMNFIVEIEIERGGHEVISRFKQAMRALPEVQQCYYVAGDADFILIIAVEDMPAYEAFTDRAFQSNPHIRKFKTTVAMDAVKLGLEVPI